MRKLHSLIKNQRIRIDNHHRGDGSALNEKGIHIHKETKRPVEGELRSVEIEVPLNNTAPFKVYSEKEAYDQIPRALKKEIQEAFKDENVKENFVAKVLDVLSSCQEDMTRDKAFKAIENISKYFDLNWTEDNVRKMVEKEMGNTRYKAYVKDQEDDTCYRLTLSPKEKHIEINDLMQKDFPSPRHHED